MGCCLALLFFVTAVSFAADVEPTVGHSVGNFKFPKPLSDKDAKYLGLAKAGEFTLKDIKAPYVLVEQFSTTCPHCLAQAPIINKLFKSFVHSGISEHLFVHIHLFWQTI